MTKQRSVISRLIIDSVSKQYKGRVWGCAILTSTLGIWSGSSKLFEAMYMLLWYLGPINKRPPLDFMESSPEAIKAGMSFYYLVGTFLLLILAVIGRRRQLQLD